MPLYLFVSLAYDVAKAYLKYVYLFLLTVLKLEKDTGFPNKFKIKGYKTTFYTEDEILYEDSRGRVVYVKDPSFSVWDQEIRAYGKRDDRARELCELRELIYDKDAIKIILFLKDDPTQTLGESLYGAYLRTIGKMRAQKRTARLLNFRSQIIAAYYFATFRIFIYHSRAYFTYRYLQFLLSVQYDIQRYYYIQWKHRILSSVYNLFYSLYSSFKKILKVFKILGKPISRSEHYWTSERIARSRQELNLILTKFYLNTCFSAVYIKLHNKSKIRYFSHATRLELYWTIIPIFIILCILIPSVFLMYGIDEDVDTAITVNVVGHQWYWSYSYDVPFLTNFSQLSNKIALEFDSYMLDEINNGAPRLLATDKILLLPETVHINFLISATDVIHSWAVPSFGVKVDAVPGRINRADVFLEQQGMFFGQCSELCGVNHSYMPIQVQSVDYFSFIEKLVGQI